MNGAAAVPAAGETIAGVHGGLVRGHVFQTTAIPSLNRAGQVTRVGI
jgi:hypothetical protein